MCWQAALPLILSAGGAAMQNKANQGLLQRQEHAAAEGILRQAALSREADTRVAQATQQIAASNPDAERDAKRATYTDALRKSLGTREGAVPTNGAVSGRFAQDSADAQTQTEAEAVQNASNVAAIEAPQYQRMNEGVAVNNAGVDLSMLKSRSQGQDYLTRLRVAMQKPNQWLQAGGQLLGGAGAATASSGGFDFAGSPFDDGTNMAGLTPAQRRAVNKGGAAAPRNPNRGMP